MTPYYSSEVENIVNQASENIKPQPVANKLFRTKLWRSYIDIYVLTYIHKPHAAVKCIVGYRAAPGMLKKRCSTSKLLTNLAGK